MRGPRQHARGTAELDDLAGVHHRHLVADPPHHAEIVADEQQADGFAPAQRSQQVENLGLHRHVQSRGRLVQDQQRRLAGKGGGDQGTLLHAAAELVRIGACHLGRAGDAHIGQQLLGAAHRGVGAQAEMLHHRLGNLAADPQRRVQRRERILEHRADPPSHHRAALRWRERGEVGPLEDDAAVDRGTSAEQVENGAGDAAFA